MPPAPKMERISYGPRRVPGVRANYCGLYGRRRRGHGRPLVTAAHAPALCGHYVLNGIGGWFLPSPAELALRYRNLKATGAGDFRDHAMADNCQYWTSTQQTADMADHIDFADHGRPHYDDKDFPRRVRAIRAF